MTVFTSLLVAFCFHSSGGFKSLSEGQKVEIKIEDGQKGPYAGNVFAF